MVKNPNVHGRFHHRHPGSPPCDNPREGNNNTIAGRRGGPGGQALSPPLRHLCFLIPYPGIGIPAEPKKHCNPEKITRMTSPGYWGSR